MKLGTKLFLRGALCLTATLFSLSTLRAQVVADGGSATLNNVTNSFTGDVTVGTNGSFTLLTLSGNTLLTNALNGIIGANVAARSNTVQLISAGARWQMGGSLVVGSNGAVSRLVISNGSSVRDAFGYIGFSTVGNSNLVTVTGTGSLWSNSSGLWVGSNGSANRLVVSNSATVAAPVAYLGFNASATNNRIVIDGGTLRVTNAAGTGLFDLRRGTNVLDNGIIDVDRLQMTVSAGRFEFNGGTLLVRSGVVSNGAPFTVGASGSVPALLALRTNQSFAITNNFILGSNVPNCQLLITNGGQLALGTNHTSYLGFNQASTNNSALLSGTGSAWSTYFLLMPSAGNQITVSNGGALATSFAHLGFNVVSGISNSVVVTGAGSRWTNRSELWLGNGSAGNQVVVTNGGVMQTETSIIGNAGARSRVLVTGAGSLWNNTAAFYLGYAASSTNELVVSNGAVLRNATSGDIGYQTSGNLALLTGAGSLWTIQTTLNVGRIGSGNQLVVSNGATVGANNLFVGANSGAGNSLTVEAGNLFTTNVSLTGTVDVRRGSLTFNSGTITADVLLATLPTGTIAFNGGVLNARTATVANGAPFIVGNGTAAASYGMSGTIANLHSFANGLAVSSNATLTGNGTIAGPLTISPGGKLVPGASIGSIILSNSPALNGATFMELGKNGSVQTNDVLQVVGALTYGGTLTVSNLGPTALAAGDRFQLFSATSFAGSFTSLDLPALNTGLGWTNKLLVDGSIEVVSVSVAPPSFAGIAVSGTNVVISGTNGVPNANYSVLTTTNVTLPLINWSSIATNQFDSSGNFSFTNAIDANDLQRYFQVRLQ